MVLTDSELRDVLREACRKAGSQLAWANANGLAPSYVSDLLKGRRGFGDRVLVAMGYEKRYVQLDTQVVECREAFESWWTDYTKHPECLERWEQGYAQLGPNTAWAGWKAAWTEIGNRRESAMGRPAGLLGEG